VKNHYSVLTACFFLSSFSLSFFLGQAPVFDFFFLVVLGLELRAYTLSHSTSPFFFCDEFFWDRVSWTICLGWLQTMIFLISAS
jgi:hypothetical protein